jgi:ATP-dependent DNA ligase
VSPDLLASLSDEDRSRLRPAPPPRSAEPMKAKLTERRFSDPAWIFERKLDGIRAMAFRHGSEARLVSRTGQNLNPSYPELVEALEAEKAEDFVADGEIVAFEGGQTSFARLQGRMQLRDPDRHRGLPLPLRPRPPRRPRPHPAAAALAQGAAATGAAVRGAGPLHRAPQRAR